MSTKISPDRKIELAENNLQRVNNWISNSDTKTGVLLAFQAGLSALLVTNAANDIKKIIITQKFDVLHFALYVSILGFLVFIARGVLYSLKALYPDVTTRESSLFFFGSIASQGGQRFKRDFLGLTEEEAEDQLNSQVHINSQIASAKFSSVKNSINATVYAAILGFVALVLISYLK